MLLALFVSIGIIVIGIATTFDLKTTLQCNPDKTIASDLSTRKFVETQCFLKYAQEFHPSIPLYVLIIINFGLVLLFSIIYAWWAKDRVEIFADPPNVTTNSNGADNESQPLLGISRAASDPMACQNPRGHIIFTVYITHLILCRIIPLVVFAALLLITSSNFPVQYDCPWPAKTTSTSHANFTQNENMNFSIVSCTYPMGSKKETVAVTVVTINFLIVIVACMELAHLLWSTWKDDNLLTDLEFCSVYLLRKRKRIRKLMKKIRENISDEIFSLHDDFGDKRLSRRKLEEIYVNVVIQEGRESICRNEDGYDRHDIFEAQFKLPLGATTFTRAADLFKATRAFENCPRTILVVGRPGIGKSLLTKKIFYEWKQQEFKPWIDKIAILIRFRNFNKVKTSFREMLRHSVKSIILNMSDTDFNGIYEHICLMPSNVILIFDGLDELKVDNEFSHDDAHILLIFKQLVTGKLLPGVTVLTTSRPTAEHIYQLLQFDQEIEILGFHEDQIKDYVEKFCRHDTQKSSEIWNLIKKSPELLSLCYIPVNSYIVCLTLKESIEVQSNVPTTITELYKRAIKILLLRHHLGYKDKPTPKNYIIGKLPKPLQNDLNVLKRIARNGMIEKQLIFEFENDDESASELSDCGLFNKLEDKRKNIFCFLHLTIQEFLAALYVVDDMENVELFLSEHINNPKWYLVIQFVAGLIGDKMRELKAQRNKLRRFAYLVAQF
jgi:Fe-S cluster biosynthesis and repair protein YggX